MKKSILIFCTFVFILTSISPAFAEGSSVVNISSPEALMYNLSTEELLYEKSSEEKIPIENLTILMTTVLLLDELKKKSFNLEDRIELSDDVWNYEGVNMFLEPTHRPKIKEILEGLTIVSANDAAIAVAELIGGSKEKFVSMMNKKAKELKMNDTKFQTPHGSTSDVSTAQDLLILVKYLLENHQDYIPYFIQDRLVYSPSNSKKEYKISNQNSFISQDKRVTGLKSGWGTRFHSITTATIDNMDFLVINLGDINSNERNKNTNSMLQYASNAYKTIEIGKKDDTYQSFYVYRSSHSGPDEVVYKDDLFVYVKSDLAVEDLQIDFEGKNYITGGKEKGDSLGKVIVSHEGKVLGETEIITTQKYKKAGFFSSLLDNIALFFSHTLMDWVGNIFK